MNVYARPWRAFAASGGRGLMSSHQATNGVPNHASARFLTGIWRGLFNATDAFTASDANDVNGLTKFGQVTNCTGAAVAAVTAGLDQVRPRGAVCRERA